MNTERRAEDTRLGKLAYYYPMIAGMVFVFVSLGGYIATVQYITRDLSDTRHRVEIIEEFTRQQLVINTRLATLMEQNDVREERRRRQ